MAAGTIPSPGSKYGPCADACEHTDCAESRTMAGGICHICGEPVGFGKPYFRESGGAEAGKGRGLVHAACVYALV